MHVIGRDAPRASRHIDWGRALDKVPPTSHKRGFCSKTLYRFEASGYFKVEASVEYIKL